MKMTSIPFNIPNNSEMRHKISVKHDTGRAVM